MKPHNLSGSVFEFPPLELADEDGLLAVGGNLTPEQLLYAYSCGIFPWYNENEPILWWSPNPRFVLYPHELYVTKNNRKLFNKKNFEITYDQDFEGVIENCQQVRRKDQQGTWITGDILAAYMKLHELGFAHSVEARKEGQLVGGLYGVSLGKCFFGESMFSLESGASKMAFIHLVKNLEAKQFDLIDCQVHTPYLESFGAKMIPRNYFIDKIKNSIENETLIGNWEKFMKEEVVL